MQTPESPDDLLTAGEAAAYLAKRWGRDTYKATAFKQLRIRWGLTPAVILPNATLWRRGDLDMIPEPDRGKPRPSRRKKKPEDSLDSGDCAVLSLA